ncbi:3-hydroxyacyl-CoA dehydrogenase family protein [Hypericibacter sp.]|uniref:3-hydroxyacyl-CoA dehydrogenase family protein n=1 Tax=Hypericibacter sp. TaxID=2705401 RepID=UPI003D6D1014
MKDDIRKVGVVGAGLMGAEIALTFALAGYPVHLVDQTEERLAAASERLLTLVRKGIARGLYQPEQKEAVFARLATATDLDSLSDCDFITEAVFEEEAAKAGIFRGLDRVCRADCIIASNTSTIPISTLASYVGEGRRSRFLGTHYFSPVSRMKLVEVIPAFGTAPEIVARVRELCEEVGKTTVLIKDVTGFAVNRMLHAFVIEAIRLVEEGVASPEDIDLACKLALGHPMGPFELMDATSSHLCLQVHEILHDAYGERFRPRPLLKQRVKAGFVGGRGKPGWRKRG